VARWPGDPLARWPEAPVAQRPSGPVTRWWHNAPVVRWLGGWANGPVTLWPGGLVACCPAGSGDWWPRRPEASSVGRRPGDAEAIYNSLVTPPNPPVF